MFLLWTDDHNHDDDDDDIGAKIANIIALLPYISAHQKLEINAFRFEAMKFNAWFKFLAFPLQTRMSKPEKMKKKKNRKKKAFLMWVLHFYVYSHIICYLSWRPHTSFAFDDLSFFCVKLSQLLYIV